MNYHHIIYKTDDMRKIGDVVTNHRITTEEALNFLDAKPLDKNDPWDPDYILDGKELWLDDLDMCLAEDYKFRVQYSAGESRGIIRDGKIMPADYMLAKIGETELYAEAETIDINRDDNYEWLKAEILRQATEKGIPADALIFDK